MPINTGLGAGTVKLAVQMSLDEMFHKGEILLKGHWLFICCCCLFAFES